MTTPATPHPTHYYATRIPHSDHWRVLQAEADSADTHYSISGGTNGLRVVTAAEAERINSTGKLAPAASDHQETGHDGH